ncbi:small membrane protein [Klebsiella michiganensis]|nr:small membrane protein [Klebsiella oxytoca]ELO7450838.1 small membrane protein [Klebsiella pneumoniae]MCW9482081.1 small membrane protein [Klebsiella oxytoca]HBR1412292.1 small membrane protein [Klebsiella pneumoniae]HBR1476274.1 small membrane protein [Klebsiella pneumoniae]
MTNLLALLAVIILLFITVYSLISYVRDRKKTKGFFKR